MNNKLTITTIAAAMGLVWSVLPAGGAETAKDKAERAADRVEDKAERAGDKMERKADTLGDKIDRGVDKTKAKAHDVKTNVTDKRGSREVRQEQRALRAKGYNPGRIDGRMGPRTIAAISDFQKAEGLPVTGQIDGETRQRLMAAAAPAPDSTSASPSTAPAGTASQGSPSAPAEAPAKSQR